MITRLANYLLDLRDRQRMIIAITKGTAMMQARRVDPTVPATWEFSGFSQNGEDGILEVLRRHLKASNRYFIEIGASDGIENNSTWLSVVEKYNGLMIEGDPKLAERAQRMVANFNIGVECRNQFVTLGTIQDLKATAFHLDPDVLSLDIDGNDYYVAKALLEAGFRPRIFVVEYNSVFGPDRSATIEYKDDFSLTAAHPSWLYYGVSISAWRRFFDGAGYRFVTVDQNGVNGFFVDPTWFDDAFLEGIRGLPFAENRYQLRKFRRTSAEQWNLIADQKFVGV